jgi:hypothetical protein
VANLLLKRFTSYFDASNRPDNSVLPEDDSACPVIFMSLPYIGKYGETLAKRCSNKIKRLACKPVKFKIHWQSKRLGFFTSTKDPTPKEFRSSLVYKFICPGCHDSYIGKTDRNLLTRIKEHSKGESEIFHHITNCNNFKHIIDLFSLPDSNCDQTSVELHEIILSNTKIIDTANHWAILLFKEAFAIKKHQSNLNHGLKASKDLILFN